jgi:hypothetical protein
MLSNESSFPLTCKAIYNASKKLSTADKVQFLEARVELVLLRGWAPLTNEHGQVLFSRGMGPAMKPPLFGLSSTYHLYDEKKEASGVYDNLFNNVQVMYGRSLTIALRYGMCKRKVIERLKKSTEEFMLEHKLVRKLVKVSLFEAEPK